MGVRRGREPVGEMTFTADAESNKLRRLHKRFKRVPRILLILPRSPFGETMTPSSQSVCDMIAFVLMVKRMTVKSELKTDCLRENDNQQHFIIPERLRDLRAGKMASPALKPRKQRGGQGSPCFFLRSI